MSKGCKISCWSATPASALVVDLVSNGDSAAEGHESDNELHLFLGHHAVDDP